MTQNQAPSWMHLTKQKLVRFSRCGFSVACFWMGQHLPERNFLKARLKFSLDSTLFFENLRQRAVVVKVKISRRRQSDVGRLNVLAYKNPLAPAWCGSMNLVMAIKSLQPYSENFWSTLSWGLGHTSPRLWFEICDVEYWSQTGYLDIGCDIPTSLHWTWTRLYKETGQGEQRFAENHESKEARRKDKAVIKNFV